MENHLVSHATHATSLTQVVAATCKQIKNRSNLTRDEVQDQLALLDELTTFELGRFLLLNKGLNGFWTHYILTHPWLGRKTGKDHEGRVFSSLECALLDRAPTLLATQERFAIFLHEIQKEVRNNAVLASVPCGLLGELLYLDFSTVEAIRLIGIDYDQSALVGARNLAQQQGLTQYIETIHKNAWQLGIEAQFDLISSNGLNIYESCDEVVVALYQQFYTALKPGGKLITSFLTPPPQQAQECEWQFDQINLDDLLLQQTIFRDIIDASWQCFRSSVQTQQQLTAAGFEEISFHYDKAHLFPTVIACKPS